MKRFLRSSNAVEIYLLRHGETEWNASGRFQGAMDSALTDRGVLQARAAGAVLAARKVCADSVFVSPLGRTRETARLVVAEGSYPEIIWDPRIAEVSLGSWDGLTHIDIDALWPGKLDGASAFNWFFRSPDGERYSAACERASDWLSCLDGVVIAVSHGLIGRIIRGVYLGLGETEALSLPVPQDVFWRMANGAIDALDCSVPD